MRARTTATGGAVRPAPEYLRHALTVVAKEAIWLATARHRPGDKKDILLFASRRGGSTWLMELITAEPRLRQLNEPYGPWHGTAAQSTRMPKFEAGQPVHLETEEDEARFRAYTDLLFSGRAPVNAPWWFWRRGYPFTSDRLLLKILEAKGLVDWFDQNYDVDVVLATRHPISQALSCIRNGWAPSSRAYLHSPWFRKQLGPKLAGYCDELMHTGSLLERMVLNWSLEWRVPLTLLPSRPHWVFVGYEECVLRPEATLDRLAARLELTNVEGMRGMLRRPSRSSGMSEASTRDEIARGEAATALRRWREKVPPEEERALLEITERLGVPLYVPGEDEPRPWWDEPAGAQSQAMSRPSSS